MISRSLLSLIRQTLAEVGVFTLSLLGKSLSAMLRRNRKTAFPVIRLEDPSVHDSSLEKKKSGSPPRPAEFGTNSRTVKEPKASRPATRPAP